MRIEIYNDGIAAVEYVAHMGTDLTIVNSARVSFGKQKEELDEQDKKEEENKIYWKKLFEQEKEERKKEKEEKEKEKKELLDRFDKEKQDLMKQIGELLTKVGNNNTTTINQQIIIRNFGEENIDYLLQDNEFINKCIECPINSIQRYLDAVHFNQAHQENKNIKLTNLLLYPLTKQ